MNPIKALTCLALILSIPGVFAQDSGAEIYGTRCAACHETPQADAAHPPPARTVLAQLPSNTIYDALSQGVMRMQATGLSNAQMQLVSEYLTGKPVEQLAALERVPYDGRAA